MKLIQVLSDDLIVVKITDEDRQFDGTRVCINDDYVSISQVYHFDSAGNNLSAVELLKYPVVARVTIGLKELVSVVCKEVLRKMGNLLARGRKVEWRDRHLEISQIISEHGGWVDPSDISKGYRYDSRRRVVRVNEGRRRVLSIHETN